MQRQGVTFASAFPGAGTGSTRLTIPPVILVLLLAAALVALNPVAYRGGGSDDWQYLNAARCAAEQGFCLPADHWWRRFAIVVPTGLSLRLLGESALSLAIVPLAFSLAALALFTSLVQRQFGRTEALIAGTAFVLTPVVTERIIGLNIDMPELLFLLGAVFALQRAHLRDGQWCLAAAGFLLGLAILCRPTQLASLPIFAAAFFLVAGWRSKAPLFAAGLAVPLIAEAAAYALAIGDPLHPWRLSLAHSTFPSSEISPLVDRSQSPLFNIGFIDGWKKEMGISVHWTLDAFLNLIANPAIGLTLLASIVLLLLHLPWLRSGEPQSRLLLFLIAAAAAFFGALVFAFAVDPKPRMFLPVLAVACTAFGVLGARRLPTKGRLLVLACLTLIAAKGVAGAYDRLRMHQPAVVAAAWSRAEPGRIAATPNASSLLTLTPEIRRLPTRIDSRPMLLAIEEGSCSPAIRHFAGWTIARERLFSREEPAWLQPLRRSGLFLPQRQVLALCLLRPPL